MKNKRGLTLLEIIISAVILSLIMGGLVGVFVAGKRWLLHNRLRMTGGELGKYFLDPLSTDVRHDQWDETIPPNGDYTNRLSIKSPPAATIMSLNGKDYTATYAIKTIPDLDADEYKQARKVTVRITWTE